MGAFQLAVAYGWWRGPSLRGSRPWVIGIFALSGSATALKGLRLLTEASFVIGPIADRFTNIFLLGLAIAALPISQRLRRPANALLVVLALWLAIAAPAWSILDLSEEWVVSGMEIPLFLAALLAFIALILRLADGSSSGAAAAWLIVLGGIGFRFSELSAIFAYPTDILEPASVLELVRTGIRTLTLPASLLVPGTWLWLRMRGRASEHDVHGEIAVVLVTVGLVFGFTRELLEATVPTAIVFSLGVIRPSAFVAAQGLVATGRLRDAPLLGPFLRGAAVFAASLIGLALGGLWGAGNLSLVFATAFALISFPLVRHLRSGQDRGSRSEPDVHRDIDSQLEPDRVTLPDDWRQQLDEHEEAYRALSTRRRQALRGLSRWQRIHLALLAAPDDDQLPRYERTTPGLHFLTHAPYAEIGTEIERANERAEAILSSLGMDPPGARGSEMEPLIDSQLGRAQGLTSPRVKSYHLTDLGILVAERIREQADLDDLTDDELRTVLGEGLSQTA